MAYQTSGLKQLVLHQTAPPLSGLLVDEGPNGNDAQAVESPCGTFDGTNEKITATDVAMSNNMSVSFFVKKDNYTTTTSEGIMCSRTDATHAFVVLFSGSHFFSTFQDGGISKRGRCLSPINDGDWVHVVVTFDNVNVNKIYFDGVEQSSENSGAGFHNTDGELVIGTRSTSNFEGQLCGMKVFDFILSPAEIDYESSAGNSGTKPADPVRHYPLSERSGSTIYNTVSNAHHGTAVNMTTGTDAGLWANRQDVFHWSLAKGFRSSGDVEIPATEDGTAAADGNAITNSAGPWYNGGVTKLDLFDGFWQPGDVRGNPYFARDNNDGTVDRFGSYDATVTDSQTLTFFGEAVATALGSSTLRSSTLAGAIQ